MRYMINSLISLSFEDAGRILTDYIWEQICADETELARVCTEWSINQDFLPAD